MGLVFHAALYLVLMITGVLLWNVGSATGTINNLEQFKGGELFRGFAVFGLFGIVLGTGIWVLGAVVFNLITELVGGIRVTVLEEEVVARTVEPDHTHG